VVSGLGSLYLQARIPEEEYVSVSDEVRAGGIASLILTEKSNNWTQGEDVDVFGGGFGKGKSSGGSGGGDTGGNDDRKEIGAYYLEMLKSDPMNSLLLRNYGKFLHEIEGDLVKAEEYYGRAILASPGDGEVLSLYGKLIWENSRDEERAKSYFDQAVNASPDDCMVLGSYAQFVWEAEDDEEEMIRDIEPPAAMVAAF
jgi:tetratricopeptide (TPR) repeat protein